VTVPLAFPVILKVHDRNHAVRPDRAFGGGDIQRDIPQNADAISLIWDDLKSNRACISG
jgi:hypothetical protein